jgi:hypothetical protein
VELIREAATLGAEQGRRLLGTADMVGEDKSAQTRFPVSL